MDAPTSTTCVGYTGVHTSYIATDRTVGSDVTADCSSTAVARWSRWASTGFGVHTTSGVNERRASDNTEPPDATDNPPSGNRRNRNDSGPNPMHAHASTASASRCA